MDRWSVGQTEILSMSPISDLVGGVGGTKRREREEWREHSNLQVRWLGYSGVMAVENTLDRSALPT